MCYDGRIPNVTNGAAFAHGAVSNFKQHQTMSRATLIEAVTILADKTQHLSDADVDQAYAWGPHNEGVRFALIGS